MFDYGGMSVTDILELPYPLYNDIIVKQVKQKKQEMKEMEKLKEQQRKSSKRR